MGTPEVGAVVIGAGAAGLAAALELQRSVSEVVVVDASDRPGGVMRTDHVGGFVVERGPNTFMVKPPILPFLQREGAEPSLRKAEPASRLRFVYRDERLVRVPLSPFGIVTTPLLSARAKLRLLTEPLRRRRDGSVESVAEFVSRRLGGEVASNLVAPFLTGVYAGDENQLGAEPVLGSLVSLERRFGSLTLGGVASALRRGPKGLRGSYSANEGFGPFARALSERLLEPPALGNRVTWLRRDLDGWHVTLSGSGGESRLRTSRVVVATPAPEAAELLRGVDPDAAAGLDRIDYAPIVSVPVGVAEGDLREPPQGFGFLVPRDADLRLLGCLFMSQLFPGRAPAGHELLHCMLGGARWREAVELPDDALFDTLRADLERTLGLNAEPQWLGVARWTRAIPQPDRDHVRVVAEVRARLAQHPGLVLAGAYLDGVSVADTFASGLRAAAELWGPGRA